MTDRARARTWFRFLVVLALSPLLALVACGGGAAGGPGSGQGVACAPSQNPVTLSFTSWVPGIDRAVELWNRDNPDIHVQLNSVPAGNAGTYNNLFNALKAGTAPDLAQLEYDALPSFRLQHGLRDISRCTGIATARSKFVDWTWAQVQLGDQGVYAIPQDTGPMVLFYRKDVFDAAGIVAPKTWDAYYQAAVKLKQINPQARITHFPQIDANWFTGLLWQNKARLFEVAGDKVVVSVDSPASRQVAQYWQKMIDEKLVATNLQGFSPDLYAAWNSGSLLSWVSAAWGYETIRDNAPSTAGRWAVAPMPQWSDGTPSAGNWGGSTTAVLSGSKHPAEAARFALWLNTDPESLAVLSQAGGLYPAANAGQGLPTLTQGDLFFGGQKIFEVFKVASGQVDNQFAWGPTMTDTYRSLSDGFSAALDGQGTLTDALAAAQAATVNSLKAQGIQASG